MRRTGALLLMPALILAACASTGPNLSSEDRLQLYGANSTPVGHFRVDTRSGTVTRWTSLGDQALTVAGVSNQTYLLELRQRCSGLAFANSIAISNSAGTVSPGFDSIQLLGANRQPTMTPSCRIATARLINRQTLNEAKQDLREASLVERDPNVTADPATH